MENAFTGSSRPKGRDNDNISLKSCWALCRRRRGTQLLLNQHFLLIVLPRFSSRTIKRRHELTNTHPGLFLLSLKKKQQSSPVYLRLCGKPVKVALTLMISGLKCGYKSLHLSHVPEVGIVLEGSLSGHLISTPSVT